MCCVCQTMQTTILPVKLTPFSLFFEVRPKPPGKGACFCFVLRTMNQPNITIEDCVRQRLQKYFQELEGEEPAKMYDMVVDAVVKPLLEVVMKHAGNNQTVASKTLGINRNTLRKLLVQHGLLVL